ncbi:hypothetical protein D3C76_899380 [compost metagenome]
MAAELAEGESRTAAKIDRHVEAVAHREIGAAAALRATEAQHLASLDADRLPVDDRFAVQLGRAIGAGQGDQRIAVEAQGRALQGEFQSRRAGMVADDAVGQAEGEIVHRTRGRHADIPVAETAGEVLHAGIGAGLQHFDDAGAVGEIVEHARPYAASGEARIGDHLAQVVEVAGDAMQAGFAEGGL